MQVLFENEIAVVTREPGFIRARRTSRPLAKLEALQEIAEQLAKQFRAAIPLRDRKELGLLIDTRDAPLATDDRTEDPIRPLLTEMMREFSRVAVLVQTAVGLLQVSRRTREASSFGHPTVFMFTDEAAAIAFLRGEEPPKSLSPVGGGGR